MKKSTKKDIQILALQERVDHIEGAYTKLIDSVNELASSSEFNKYVVDSTDPSNILDVGLTHIKGLLSFEDLAFYLIEEKDASFYPARSEPESNTEKLRAEVNQCIEDGTFAWALRQNHPIIVPSKLSGLKLILHVLATQARTRGMFVGTIKDENLRINELSVTMLSITVHNISYALESALLYQILRKDSEIRLSSVVETATDGIISVDSQGKIVLWNKGAEQTFGYTASEVYGKDMSFIMPPGGLAAHHQAINNLLTGTGKLKHKGKAFEVSGLRKDGSEFPIELTAAKWETNEEVFFTGIIRDVTERKEIELELERHRTKLEALVSERTSQLQQAIKKLNDEIGERRRMEETLRDSEKLIRNILDTVDEGFIVIDSDFRILLANNAYCSQVGLTCNDIIGRHCYEISHKSLLPCFEEGEACAVNHVFETGEPCSMTHRHPDAKGDSLHVETKAFPIKDSSGTIISVIEIVQNITEKYLLEEERMKTQKLEAIGTLAGGIAHDFNNLLQGVFGYIYMAKISQDDKERSRSMLEQAEKALHMSVNLTTQLLTFSKGGKPVKKKISLQSVIGNSVRFALSGSRADSRINLDTDLWQVEADEGQIAQVIQNIVLNADQSMPLGGTIVITAKNMRAPKKGSPQLLEAGKYVEISVQDNGIGISEEYLPKIFDPYFTTKLKGSGLGLATCYSIIKNHGGIIQVSSNVGKGTTFYVYLPAVEAAEEAPRIPEFSPFVRKAKILVMDDEEMIRDIAGKMIEVLGHEAESAKHGEEAIEKYKAAMASGNPFDIVILDLTIRGGMGGRETIERLVELDSNIRAVVSTGFSDDTVISDHHNYGFSARLTKPYKLEELGDTLNKLLSR
jgi:PAS domain S-box-containing protein